MISRGFTSSPWITRLYCASTRSRRSKPWTGPSRNCPWISATRRATRTTTMFAALDIASGKVIAKCKARHRHQEFLAFLRLIDKEVPTDLDIHLVLV